MHELKQTTTLDFGTKPIFHVGISSGKDSTALLLWVVHKSGIPHDQIRVTFADTGNEDPLTIEHLRKIHREIIAPARIPFGLETLHPKRDFFELAFAFNMFPTRVRQFCTIELKIEPLRAWLRERWEEGIEVIILNGKRVGESRERKKKMTHQPERSFSTFWGCEEWMPLREWSLDDVLGIHKEFKFPLNPLYGLGAHRVGCWPCINCGKREIRLVSKQRPEKIALIAAAEQRFETEKNRVATFFPATTAMAKFRTKKYTNAKGEEHQTAPIEEVVKWAHTARGGKKPHVEKDVPKACFADYSACE